MHSNSYRAFDSINHAPLATLGVDVEWNRSQLLQVGSYAKASTSGLSVLSTHMVPVALQPGIGIVCVDLCCADISAMWSDS